MPAAELDPEPSRGIEIGASGSPQTPAIAWMSAVATGSMSKERVTECGQPLPSVTGRQDQLIRPAIARGEAGLAGAPGVAARIGDAGGRARSRGVEIDDDRRVRVGASLRQDEREVGQRRRVDHHGSIITVSQIESEHVSESSTRTQTSAEPLALAASVTVSVELLEPPRLPRVVVQL